MIDIAMKNPTVPDAALFDMDGLLIDTERLSLESFAQTCTEYSLGDQRALFLSLVGSNEASLMLILQRGIGDRVDVKGFRGHWAERYHVLITEGELLLKPGVPELLAWLALNRVKLAVATSSATSIATMKLTRTGIIHWFQEIVGGDTVRNSKPDPEIFLNAAAVVGADKTRTIVFEDSSNGVKAGVAAGFAVFQVPDLVEPTAELLLLQHRVCKSLHEVLDILKSGEFQFSGQV
ncbi:HAD family hydrolase [Granulosicoccus antarcticus]|uniref:Phosphorylated carbohydrates phosphatase n=1 Tax=Granulosicoccus antarcticus IMCC3135 TaxID=1192854 RepID=A0A2Z2NRI2_9GAMM|nr:HAD family phosphatase [Granulosicoccus antarcticus]ASJ72348.1 Phosphorylated carbohydrates phosphatase [Granulosicoccus antarcticus IMCC3135]